MGQIGNRLGVARMITRCQGGGDKKAGLVPTATGQMLSHPFAWRAALGGLASGSGGNAGVGGAGRGNGGNKVFKISTVNQIGGIGRYRTMTGTPRDGVNRKSILVGANNCSMTVNRTNWNNPPGRNVIVAP